MYFVVCPPLTSYSGSFLRPKLGRDTYPQPEVFNQSLLEAWSDMFSPRILTNITILSSDRGFIILRL